MTDDGARVGAASRNPARRAQPARGDPRTERRPRQSYLRSRFDHEVGGARRRGGHRATRCGVGLRELRQHAAVAESAPMEGGREAVRGPRSPYRDKDRIGACAREQELEAADLVAAGHVFALQPQRLGADRAGERRRRIERRRPVAQTALRKGATYLCGERCGVHEFS